ncbi:MAG: sel1 repeat family protein [Clostridiales bacterium]|nr:sel1 repeat family protein [Clostridiales bacterium]
MHAFCISRPYASGLPETTKEKPKETVKIETAESLYDQGMKFFNGDGVAQNYYEAANLFAQASNKGSGSAQCRLGVMYQDGLFYKKNLSEAVEWFKKSADQGCAEAQFNLGGCYYKGLGVEKNISEAVNWFRKSADQGYVPAQVSLGFVMNMVQESTKTLAKR